MSGYSLSSGRSEASSPSSPLLASSQINLSSIEPSVSMASESAEAPPGDKLPAVALTPISPNKLSLKMSDPSRKKLVSPEAQRVAAVLDECICDMELVAMLPSELTNPETPSVSLGAEAARALAEHLRLVRNHNALKVDAGEDERDAVARAVQDSLQNALRLLRACPTVGAELKRAGPITEDRRGVCELVLWLKELRAILLERLLTTPAEEREHSRHIQEVSMRHHSNLEAIGTLEKEVAAAIKDRDEEISKKDEVIRGLKGSLYQMDKSSKEFIAQTQRDADRQVESCQKTSEGKQTRLQQEASQLRAQLRNLIAEHREAELALRKKKHNMETEIENWIQKYDADMGEKQVCVGSLVVPETWRTLVPITTPVKDGSHPTPNPLSITDCVFLCCLCGRPHEQTELEQVAAIYEEEKAELRDLQEHYTVLELEYSQIMEERKTAREQREQEEREREVKSHAAVIIQAFWRGSRVRKAIA
ncbi:hypothetical protein NFI96_032280 [Prochilodus magdalenae]|nr:hypothetical protein NFI96_032280 [Prochilodus magdalenae]